MTVGVGLGKPPVDAREPPLGPDPELESDQKPDFLRRSRLLPPVLVGKQMSDRSVLRVDACRSWGMWLLLPEVCARKAAALGFSVTLPFLSFSF